MIAAIHGVTDAQPFWSHTTVARLRREDPDYAQRYQKLLAATKALQRKAGFANANLKRGLTRTAKIAGTPPGSNYMSNGQLRWAATTPSSANAEASPPSHAHTRADAPTVGHRTRTATPARPHA